MFTTNSTDTQTTSSIENNKINSLSEAIQHYKDKAGNDNGIIKAKLIDALQNDNATAQHIIKELDLRITDTVTEVKLINRKLSQGDIELIAEILKVNTTLLSLDLRTNKVGNEGAKALANVLEINQSLTFLNLAHTSIGKSGVVAIATALKKNHCLTTLVVTGSDNEEGESIATAMAKALEYNNSLTSLKLASCEIDADGAELIADALKKNYCLTQLDLSYNPIGTVGTKAIVEALKCNNSLTYLKLVSCEIDAEGNQAIADFLKINKSLTFLYIDSINAEGNQAIVNALETNNSLQYLMFDNDTSASSYQEQIDKFLTRNKLTKLQQHWDRDYKKLWAESEIAKDDKKIIKYSELSQELQKHLTNLAVITLNNNKGGVEELLTKGDLVRKLKAIIEEEQQDFTFTINEQQPIAASFAVDASTGQIKLSLEQNEIAVLQDVTTLDKLDIGSILRSLLDGLSINELIKFLSYLKPEDIKSMNNEITGAISDILYGGDSSGSHGLLELFEAFQDIFEKDITELLVDFPFIGQEQQQATENHTQGSETTNSTDVSIALELGNEEDIPLTGDHVGSDYSE